ncbi:MAG TPA: hypothetical protein PKW66_08155 [Polyangiaceae bacterium]|nr:hypothetical protein [Polyangiaceae bacterium]
MFHVRLDGRHRWMRVTPAFVVVASLLLACGGNKQEPAKTAADTKQETVPGMPKSGDEGWCDPMPDLGESCKSYLKECTIVCDYMSDTCAVLVCMSGR